MSCENYSKICRTCLAENTNMKSIYDVVNYLPEESAEINKILISFASVQISRQDGLPEQVCLECVEELNRAFVFKKLCEKSDETLRSLLLSNNHHSKFQKEDEIVDFVDKIKNEQVTVVDIKNVKQSCDVEDNYGNTEDSNQESISNSSKEDEDKPIIKSKTYNCDKCDTICNGLAGYRRHITQEHGQIYKCKFCDKKFTSKTTIRRHESCHKQLQENKQNSTRKTGVIKKRNLPRTCNICNKTFRFHSNLERHKLVHTGEKPFLCNVCGKGFAQLSYLKIHSFIHTGEKPYQCQMCDKSFAAPGTLMTHIRTHTGERPHVCKICGKDFPQSGYLSAHIRTHTGEKPVECNVCHRRFNQSGRLIIHMRIHSGEKPYACKDCGRCFAVKGTLKKHIRTHTGERPYVCNVCGQAFAQSGTLATHMKVHKPK